MTTLIDRLLPHLTSPELDEQKATELYMDAANRYNEPWRHYHTARHLAEVANYLLDTIDSLHNPRATLWAAVDHDIVYVPQASSGANEELSAQLSEQRLDGLLPEDEIATIGSYIRHTADHSWDSQDTDLALLLDADLKILGAEPSVFDEYDKNIGLEYSHFDPVQYKLGRAGVLQTFYDKDRLFLTDTAHTQFEAKAKENLKRKISELLK